MKLRVFLFLAVLAAAGNASAQVAIKSGGGSGSSPATVTVDTLLDAQFCVDSVGTDAYACSSTNCPAAIANGQRVTFYAGTANTTGATFAFCGQAAKALVRYIGGISTALTTGDILAKQPVTVNYNATDDNWKLSSVPATAGLVGVANTWALAQTYSNGAIITAGQQLTLQANGSLLARTLNTPDIATLATNTNSNTWDMIELGDAAFDFQLPCTTGLGTSPCTDPTFVVHSHNQDTGEFFSVAHDGLAAVFVGGNGTNVNGTLRLGGTVALTAATDTTVVTVPVASGAGTGGVVEYTVFASDGTDHQSRSGAVRFSIVNKAGTETCTVYGTGPTTQAAGGDTTNPANPTQVQDGSGVGAITSSTLTYAWVVDTTGTNNCAFRLNAVSGLVETTLRIDYQVRVNGPGSPTGGP